MIDKKYLKELKDRVNRWVEETGNSKDVEEFKKRSAIRNQKMKDVRNYAKRFNKNHEIFCREFEDPNEAGFLTKDDPRFQQAINKYKNGLEGWLKNE